MNVFRGLGVCAVLAGIAYSITKVTEFDLFVTGLTITVVILAIGGYVLSARRRRHDRRAARGPSRGRGRR